MRIPDVDDVIKDVPYVLDAFSEIVREDPDRLLVVNPVTRKSVSRKRADELSARLYRYLKDRGITRESHVMICLPRGEMPLLAILGTLKAGAAFTLVDDTYVQERINYIREDFSVDVFLDIHAWHDAMREEPLWGFERASDHDLCLAVYTSGTTGSPKGVLNEYGDIKLLYLSLLAPRAALGNRGRVSALVSPLNFVAAIKRVFDLFMWGDTMHVLPMETVKNPSKLREYVRERGIEHAFMTPSFFRTSLMGVGGSFRLVTLGGELANGIFCDDIDIFNEYGMSETVFSLFMSRIDKAWDVCPCGPVSFDWAASVLDEDGGEQPEGEEGEICFPNPFFRGYANLPDKTAQVLRGGIFHSGDLGMVRDGQFYVKGRTDDMIKINGNRVEPAEIEAVAKRLIDVEWCGVRGFEDEDRSFLCFYYKGELTMDPRELRDQMGRYLPSYMLPTYFVQVDEVPLNANGKLSRRLLPRPDVSSFVSEYVAPQTEAERQVCAAFENVLQRQGIGVDDDFYYLGGDSLSTMRLVGELPGDCVSTTDVFRERTPRAIAKILEHRLVEPDMNADERELKSRRNAYPLTPTQLKMFDFQLYTPKSCMWNLPHLFSFDRQAIDVERLVDAVRRAVDHHPIFRTVFGFDENGSVFQHIDYDLDVAVEVERVSDDRFEELRANANTPFRLIGVPLIRVRLFETPTRFHVLLLAHHAVIDGMGINAVLNSVEALYRGAEELPLDTYYSWLESQRSISASVAFDESRAYFERTYGTDEWCINLTPDNVTRDSARSRHDFMVRIPDDVLERLEKQDHLSRNGLWAALALFALSATEARENVLLSWVYANRTTVASMSAAGLMLRFLPLGVTVRDDGDLDQLFREVARRTDEAVAHSCYDWLPSRELAFETDPLMLVYESSILDFPAMRAISETVESTFLQDPTNTSIGRVSLQVLDSKDGMLLCAFYAREFFEDGHVDRFHDAIRSCVERLGGTMEAVG